MEMTIPCVFGVFHLSIKESFMENKRHFLKTYQFVQFNKVFFFVAALNRLKDRVLSMMMFHFSPLFLRVILRCFEFGLFGDFCFVCHFSFLCPRRL